jgi:hypothetical protein
MTYDIVIQEKQHYLEVRVSGTRIKSRETKDALDMWRVVAEKCNDTGMSHVLVILSLTGGSTSIMPAYDIASSAEQVGWRRKFKTAIVDLNEESRQVNLFGETVAVNRGFSQIKVFDDENKAVEWLQKS